MEGGAKQGTLGKKRKKKPKKEGGKTAKAKGTFSPNKIGHFFIPCGTGTSSPTQKKAPIPLAVPLAKCDDCSSGSSLDQQPQVKHRK